MTPNQYLEESSVTATKEDLLHAVLGMVTEAAELADAIKKEYAYGKPIDNVNIIEELGDILWYIAMATRHLGTSFENLFDVNIAKLRARYPDGFNARDALIRNLERERIILEQGSENDSISGTIIN